MSTSYYQSVPAGVDVFVSHSHADAEFAQNFAAQLESEEIAENGPVRKIRVFLDRWDIKPGENFPLRLIEALSKARCVACLLSPEFLTSDWSTFEYVTVLAEDPLNRRGKLVGLRLRDLSLDQKTTISLRAPFHMNNWLDFRRPQDFAPGIIALVGHVRGEPITRGTQRTPLAGPAIIQRTPPARSGSQPDLRSEVLISNLLPIMKLPSQVWVAPTGLRKRKELPKDVRFETLPPFILRDEQLITFSPIGVDGDPRLCDSKSAKAMTVDARKDDLKLDRWITELVGRCVKDFLPTRRLKEMGRDRYIFPAPLEGQEVKIKSGKHQQREVTKKAVKPDGSVFWIHQAAFVCVVRIDDAFFVELDPTYCFSHDGGRFAIKGKTATKLSIRWLGKQQNVQLLRDLVFWANWLSSGNLEFEIPTGGDPLIVSASPAQAGVNVGIVGDEVKVSALIDQGTFTVDEIVAESEVGEADESETETEVEDES